MRRHLMFCFALSALFIGVGLLWAHHGPAKLVFKAKNGDVVFDHSKHTERLKNDCKVCHTRLWPQSAKAPLNFKFPHKAHEQKQASCGSCHRAGGTAFAASAAANCTKCHVKK